jgi:PAS domain S-box-containing protein
MAEDRQRRDAPGTPPVVPVEIHRLLVASVIDYAIFALDPTGRVASWNEGAERMKGYAAEEIIGRHFSTFYPPEALALDHPAYELEVAEREGRYEEEGWRVRKDGTLFWANVVITALRDEAGQLVGFAKVTRDLTERRAAQEQAIADARRLAEARAASRAKSAFLMTLSHELRTPLNAIGGYVDLLAMGIHGPVTEAQADALDRIRGAQRRLLMLITDLLNLGRIEAGRLHYDLADVPLAEVVADVRAMVEPLASNRRITLDWQAADPEVVAYADRDKVEQILLNLLTNGIKYTEAGGCVVVTHGSHEDQAVIDVRDTGIGIPAEATDSIFEPFTQIGRGYSSPRDGVGLGLAISRDLARAMGGDITVTSDVGRGSTFTLRLPLAPRPDPRPSHPDH